MCDVMITEFEPQKNILYQKIGRNVVLFQQIENILKYLLGHIQIEGYASEIQAIGEQRSARISKLTMGQTVGQFVKNVYAESENHWSHTNAPEDLREPWLKFGFTIQGEGLYERRRKALASIVAERNALIHHIMPTWNLESEDSRLEAEEYLDLQYDRAVSEFNYLKEEVNQLLHNIKVLADFMQSGEYKKMSHTLKLKGCQLIAWLGKVSRQVAREDGWMALSTAAQNLPKEVREEVTALKRQYGYKTLKDLMLATEIFDFRNETTKKGGNRLLYRVKPESNYG